MRNKLLFLSSAALAIGVFSTVSCGGRQMKDDTYTGDKLNVSVRNLYFEEYQGGDLYLAQVEDKFGLKFDFSTYEWSQWQNQISGAIAADDMTDIFHANITSYNFANVYKFWAEEEMAKPLPDDLSAWPYLKAQIEHTSNVDSLKINGKLYGIPIFSSDTKFSPFTYVYRRDWAKKWGVYQNNDEYTFEQFIELLEVFRDNLAPDNKYALADVEWGFPSIPNFYKQVPHCFAQDSDGHYVNNYTTAEYVQGLEKSKNFYDNGYYYPDQNSAQAGQINTKYTSGQFGVFFENLSYQNYYDMRSMFRQNNPTQPQSFIDDATAIMKIKGENGKYSLEGTDNWFSMTFFDYKISDNKMNRVLDMINWLLSPEGTRLAVYGKEGYDYKMVAGVPEIIETNWDRQPDGSFAPKQNGAKKLRYLATLSYDTLDYDPAIDKTAYNTLKSWENEMKAADTAGNLRVLKENKNVMWLTTPLKSLYSGQLRTNALINVQNYIIGELGSLDSYYGSFESSWGPVLDEINQTLGV